MPMSRGVENAISLAFNKVMTGEAEPAEETFTAEEAAAKAKAFLQDVLRNMGIEVMIEKMIKSDKIILHLHGKNLGILIGKHLRYPEYSFMYFFDFIVPRLIERGKIRYFLFFFLRLLFLSPLYGIELLFFLLFLASAQNIKHIFALIEKPRLTL